MRPSIGWHTVSTDEAHRSNLQSTRGGDIHAEPLAPHRARNRAGGRARNRAGIRRRPDEGERFATRVRAVLSDLGDAVRELTERANPRQLRVSVMPSFAARWLLPRLPALEQARSAT